MQLTKYGSPIGTPFYMSPEQWFGDGPGFTALDGRTDIYALGCTLYESLAGNPPFMGKTKDELRQMHLNEQPRPLDVVTAHVPEAVSRVVLRALEKDRDLRPASAAEFAAELRRAFDESSGRVSGEQERERSSARSESEAPTPEEISLLQTTEESFSIVRDWAAGEAQQLIEQVRELPPANAQTPSRSPTEIEDPEATLVPDLSDALNEQPELDKPHTAQPPSAEVASKRAPDGSRATHELMLAQAGAWHIGLFAEEVESVNEWRAPVPLPHAPPAVLGVVSVRGRMLTVIDPGVLLGERNAAKMNAAPAFIIVLRGDEQLALAVNRVGGSIGIFAAEIELPAQAAGSNVMRGIVQGTHGETIVLDARELFSAAMQGAERRRQRT
jgi:chemotaxis signal transduction protein